MEIDRDVDGADFVRHEPCDKWLERCERIIYRWSHGVFHAKRTHLEIQKKTTLPYHLGKNRITHF